MASTKDKNSKSLSNDKLAYNLKIAQKLTNAGFDIFLPQDHPQPTVRQTFQLELNTIRECEFMIILLSDTRGIYLEAGFAKGIGKKIYAIKLPGIRVLSEWSECWYDYIAKDADELIEYLKDSKRDFKDTV